MKDKSNWDHWYHQEGLVEYYGLSLLIVGGVERPPSTLCPLRERGQDDTSRQLYDVRTLLTFFFSCPVSLLNCVGRNERTGGTALMDLRHVIAMNRQ